MIHTCEMRLPPDARLVFPVTHFVETFARACGMPAGDAFDLASASMEAVTNAVVHAYEADEAGEIHVTCALRDDALEVGVSDRGLPFDPDRVVVHRPADDLDDFSAAGLGFFLMRALTDEVRIENLGLDGKRVVLRKSVKAAAAPEAPPRPTEALPAVDDVEVRMMTPADAIGVARCLYRAYGLTYVHEELYHPDRVIEMNRTGEMMTAVAVLPGGEVVGTQSMRRPRRESRIFVSGVAAVVPAWRDQGLSGRLAGPLQRALANASAVGLVGYGVTEHVYSQQMMAKAGFHVCGLFLGRTSASMAFRGMRRVPQRLSQVVACVDWVGGWRPQLHVPPQHREMLERLYANMGWHPTFAPAGDAPRPADTHLDVEHEPRNAAGLIHVHDIGSDAEPRVWGETGRLRRLGCEAVLCFVPLRDPHAPALVEGLERRGFFFGGVTPGEGHGDTSLVLQWLGVPLAYGDVQVAGEVAADLLAYIRARDPNQ